MWCIIYVHMTGDHRKKKKGESDIIVYLSIYRTYNCTYAGTVTQVTTETRPAAMETPVHADTMCTRSFLLLNKKSLGMRLTLIDHITSL